ncbi:MAG: hypothetical protein H6553_03405 [Chitinophagales bacterium]|nr:hypothetical protein [Chitinophagales bacterium]
MKNIKAYIDDCFTFHEQIVASKKKRKSDQAYKDRLIILNPIIKIKIKEYIANFKLDKLQNLLPHNFSNPEEEDLGNLYNYKNKKLQKLKVLLTTDENNRVNSICQNCTISEVNSFDHYLPKSEFPEFIVNPLNLIPSCTKCNGQKSSIWRANGKRKFLNLYIDKLPNIQYLFVKVLVQNNDIDIEYYLDAKNGIEQNFFELLQYHYDKLNLFERFKENSDIIISELEIEISKYLKRLSIDEIKNTILEECQDNYRLLGRNNWKLILKSTLINDMDYLERFNTKNFI